MRSPVALTFAPKRRWLSFSLRTFLVVTLLLSGVLGYFGRAWWKAYRDSQPPTLYELAQIAKRHGIPMPPKEAKLVLVLSEWPQPSSNGPIFAYTPGFLLRGDADRVVVLVGSDQQILATKSTSASPWREFGLNSTAADGDQYFVDYYPSSALICAAQLSDQGERGVAAKVLSDVLKTHEGLGYPGSDVLIDVTDLRLTMGRCAYVNYAGMLQKQPDSWPDLRVRLQALIDEFPKLKEEHCGGVLRDLALAVDAMPAAAGSVEERLVAWSLRGPDGTWGPFDLLRIDEEEETDPDYVLHAPAREIVLRGFDAVPELIKLVDDQRLTAHADGDEDDGTLRFRRLGQLASDLLKEISGFNRGGESLSVPFSDEERDPDTATWQQWFEQAKAQGERQYLVENLHWRTRDRDRLRDNLCYILARKHPNALFDLIADHFHSPHARGNVYDFALAIRDANLPVRERIELLVTLFQSAPKAEQPPILWALARLDQKKAAYFVLKLLDDFPTDVEGKYSGSPEAELAAVVTMIDDERVWRELLKATRAANVGLRQAMLANIAHRHPNRRLRAYRLALLAAFLDDEAVSDPRLDPERFHSYQTVAISIRDLATLALALSFEIEDVLGLSAPQWSALREQVRQRLAEEELPELE